LVWRASSICFGKTPRGEDNVQFAGGDPGVVVEQLVKVAQPEQEQRIGIAGL
jgi:hypothetical protein